MGALDFIDNLVRSYPIQVVVAELRNDKLRWDRTERASRVQRKGVEFLILKKRKGADGKNQKVPVMDYSVYDMTRKGNSIIFLFSPQEGQYIPMRAAPDLEAMTATCIKCGKVYDNVPIGDKCTGKIMKYVDGKPTGKVEVCNGKLKKAMRPTFRIMNKNMETWKNLEYRATKELFPQKVGTLEKWMPFLQIVVPAVTIILTVFFIADKIDVLASMATDIAGKLVEFQAHSCPVPITG